MYTYSSRSPKHSWDVLGRLLLACGLPLCFACTGAPNVKNSRASDLFPNLRDTELAHAAAAGRILRMRELVESGANINAVGADGVTPLLWALRAQNKRGVQAALELGANSNQVIPDGLSAISLASAMEDSEYLRLMLENGADPNLRSGDGEPILHTAIMNKRWPNVEMLLEYGADIDIRSATGLTPVLLCAYLDDFERVSYFLARGADFSIAADNGSTLAYEVEASRLSPQSERGKWVTRVRQTLVERGVRFPSPTPTEVRNHLSKQRDGVK